MPNICAVDFIKNSQKYRRVVVFICLFAGVKKPNYNSLNSPR